MKRLMYAVVVLGLCLITNALHAQLPMYYYQSGPHFTRPISGTQSPNISVWDPIVDGSALPDGSFRVGRWDVGTNKNDDILCFQWDLPSSLGPGAVVDTVRLTMQYSNDSGKTLSVYFYAPNYDLAGTDRAVIFYDAALERIPRIPLILTAPVSNAYYHITIDGNDGEFLYWTRPATYGDDPLSAAVQDAVDNHGGTFSLLFRAAALSLPNYLWYIDPSDVTLEIYYHTPDPEPIEDVRITNVVNGIVDYDLEPASRVRGDMNIFHANSYYADYAQLPPFEPPYATRTWLTWRHHIAETWFSKFEDPSLPGRHKFHDWDTETNKHSVRHITSLYDGLKTEFRAKTRPAYPARHLVKRELHYGYDGLSIDYRDPWRVVQDTDAGGPDSAQTMLDSYQPQATPYEPWNDPQSWGVFLDIDTDHALHYGTRYWKYYSFDSQSDSYTRKDDPVLAEGDLIHMDEILPGAGTSVSPTGGIESVHAGGGGLPYNEYRLEYRDGQSTMDFTGIYKAHRLSDREGQPTRSANQRKLDIDPFGTYHLVYESAGEVWYTQSEDGVAWTREELVSDFTHTAVNPSLAVLDSSVYVTFIESDMVVLKRRYKGVWLEYPLFYNYDEHDDAASTPVVAAGRQCTDAYGNPKGDIVLVLWNHDDHIRYNLLWLYYHTVHAQEDGIVASNAVDQPLFPAVDADNEFIRFTAAWREGGTIRAAELLIPSCNPVAFSLGILPMPDVSFDYETAVHAPSITHNAETRPVVAYEVLVPSLIYSDRWVNIRTYDMMAGSWNTTLFQIPYYQFTQYAEAIAPSIGAHQQMNWCGQHYEPGLRVAFHRNWGGGIRVGVIDCNYTEYDQLAAGESFPSVVPFAPAGMLRETYSAPYAVGPFLHAVRTTNDYLTKQATPDIRLVRDLRVGIGGDVAMLGVTELSVLRGNNTHDAIEWHAMPDSLVVGIDAQPHELLYTEAFTLASGDEIAYRAFAYCSDAQAMPTGVSLSLEVRKASDNSVLHSFSLPLRMLPSDTAIWTSWSRTLAQVPPFPVYLALGIDGTLPAQAELATGKVWLEDQYIPKTANGERSVVGLPDDCMLDRNHPNPFGPATIVPFALGREGHVRLSVHDALGREIAVLIDELRPAGHHQAQFDAGDLPSGTYIARLAFGDRILTRNLMLVR